MIEGTAEFNRNAVNDIAEGKKLIYFEKNFHGTLIILIPALKAIFEIRDEVEPLFNDATGDEQCINIAVSNWRMLLNSSGSTIASCIGKDDILAVMETINKELIEQHAVIFDLQNSILNSFSEVNIVTNQQGLTPFISTESVRIVQTFIGYTAMRFGSLLSDFDRISRNEMIQLQTCIADVVSRVRDEAIVVANTLEFC